MNNLYVVGIGPGKTEGMTIEAYNCLKQCNVIAGFVTYCKLVSDEFPDKEYIMNGMGGEKERCILALEKAKEGNDVALICSGDSSVYGMAGLVYELSVDYPDVNIKSISGVTAALSGSSLLGAAVGHDFACVSLSDYMISFEKIVERLTLLARADMVICLYNTRSKKRPDSLKNACDALLEILPENTNCGIVKNIGRDGEVFKTMSLIELRDFEADMFTTVFIGNSGTKVINGRLVTPRGYICDK